MPPPTRLSKVTPQNHLRFDPWNSASTGHQRGVSHTGTGWRQTREEKLALQFQPARAHDSNPPGEWVWSHTAQSDPDPGQKDIRSMFRIAKAPPAERNDPQKQKLDAPPSLDATATISVAEAERKTIVPPTPPARPDADSPPTNIFQGLVVYLNAPSHPLLSDHKLRHLLTTHGATVSLALSRRVTHVLVGKPNAGPARGGFGGGLSTAKLQKEIARAGNRAVKVVFVDWVVESVKAEKRLPEMRFAMHVAAKGQRSLLSAFSA